MYDEDQIAERIMEDEAAVAEVCDEPSMPLGSDDMNSCPEVTDDKAKELIEGQKAVDKLDAEEAEEKAKRTEEEKLNGVSDEDIDLVVFNSIDEDTDDVESDDVDFDFA